MGIAIGFALLRQQSFNQKLKNENKTFTRLPVFISDAPPVDPQNTPARLAVCSAARGLSPLLPGTSCFYVLRHVLAGWGLPVAVAPQLSLVSRRPLLPAPLGRPCRTACPPFPHFCGFSLIIGVQ